MSSYHEEFVATLESLKELKSGISGSRIKRLTNYALENVNAEEYLIHKIAEYSRTCPPSHKLGSLYVIDSVGRAFLNRCKELKQSVESNSPVGTYGHALFILGESIQCLLKDGIEKSSSENRDKIKDLVDIWDKADLFQKGILNAVRSVWFNLKDSGKSCSLNDSTTTSNTTNNVANTCSSSSSSSSSPSDPKEVAIKILSNLKPNDSIPTGIQIPTDLESSDLTLRRSALMQLLAKLQHEMAHVTGSTSVKNNQNHHNHLQGTAGVSSNNNGNNTSSQRSQNHHAERHEPTQYIGRSARSNKRSSDLHIERSRSKSPKRHDKKGNAQSNTSTTSTTSNGSANLNSITTSSTTSGNCHHLYPEERNNPANPHFRPRHVSFDPSLAADHIKVYSRTLFVGGVPNSMREYDIARLLGKYGQVQSVILNNSRKHAFVKVYSRQEADSILVNCNKDESSPLRIRWAVGFGPRDCCDYDYGFSIIPMQRLTEVDRKWSLCAEWGGTGGQPLQSGMVFEEPDIIVGEGVSSKAISQKMPTDRGNGPKSGKQSQQSSQQSSQQPSQQSSQQPSQQPPQPTNVFRQSHSPPTSFETPIYPPPPQAQPQPAYGPIYQNLPPQLAQPPAPPRPPSIYPQQSIMPVIAPQHQSHDHQQQTQAPAFDPTAQLNSLMSMLNKQQQ